MKIQKAVITAASPGQHTLPLQRLVDRQGVERTALELVLSEVSEAGIEEICVVIQPGDERAYQQAAGEHAGRVCFVEQPAPLGYGDALRRSKSFVKDSHFLHLVGDHLYLSQVERCCAAQLIETAVQNECSVSAVQATRESMLPYFGTVSASRVHNASHLYKINQVVEKPTPTFAEQELIVAGLRQGTYLCFFGMHILPPEIMEILNRLLESADDPKSITLSAALNELASTKKYLAFEVQGKRYNIGIQYGVLVAQLAIALAGQDRDRVLTDLVELLATTPQGCSHD
ncbi:MAG: sugar phosphate nucleotidyltransferase [Planctomycetota bacterium]|nr:sugar phosphate nucleotidyltransferase [Planctomycetota bacterium]